MHTPVNFKVLVYICVSPIYVNKSAVTDELVENTRRPADDLGAIATKFPNFCRIFHITITDANCFLLGKVNQIGIFTCIF